MLNETCVFAPATVANVACGFDIFGFAVAKPGDEVIARPSNAPGVSIRSITGDGGRLPLHPEKNTASHAVVHLLKSLGIETGIELEIHKKMPMGSGLGSSAASSAAALVAVNELLETPLSREELLPFAMEGERMACGAAHADNVAPSLLGGFILISSYDPLNVVRIPVNLDIWVTVVHPHIEIRTEDARRVLRTSVDLSACIKQCGNTAGVIAGLMLGDIDLLEQSVVDNIIEPQRSLLIPGFDIVKQSALEAGALASSISGSGPSVFALCKSEQISHQVAEHMQSAFKEVGLDSEAFISPINQEGPIILSIS